MGNIRIQTSLAESSSMCWWLVHPHWHSLNSLQFCSIVCLLPELLLPNKDGTSLLTFCYTLTIHSLVKSRTATKGNSIRSSLKWWQDHTTTHLHAQANCRGLSSSQLASSHMRGGKGKGLTPDRQPLVTPPPPHSAKCIKMGCYAGPELLYLMQKIYCHNSWVLFHWARRVPHISYQLNEITNGARIPFSWWKWKYVCRTA